MLVADQKHIGFIGERSNLEGVDDYGFTVLNSE